MIRRKMNHYQLNEAKELLASGQLVGAQIVQEQNKWMVRLLSKDDAGWLVVLGQQVKKLASLGSGIAAAREIGFTAAQLQIMK